MILSRWVALLLGAVSAVGLCRTNALLHVQSRAISRLPDAASFNGAAVLAAHHDVQTEIATTESRSSTGALSTFRRITEVAYDFSRPHTIKGTALAAAVGIVRALREHPGQVKPAMLFLALYGLAALILGNVYIVGINQIYDVDVDLINKPYLPIAARRLSRRGAWILVLACLSGGVAIVKTKFSPFITRLYLAGLALGTLYSVPPFQLKRFPLAAAATIAVVRGFLLNFGVYYAARDILGMPFQWNPAVVYISTWTTLFAIVIAISKVVIAIIFCGCEWGCCKQDMADIAGDKAHSLSTFSTRYGVDKVAGWSTALLALLYCGSLLANLLHRVNTLPILAGHGLCLAHLLYTYTTFHPSKQESVQAFYKTVWRLFYMEYLLYSVS